MKKELLKLIVKSLENSEEHLTRLFRDLNGLEIKNTWGSHNQGLRPIGSEALLQSELYHTLRSSLQESYIIAREFKPFSGMETNSTKDSIDLAIFDDLISIKNKPATAKIWIELKITGGLTKIKKEYSEDFEKLLRIAERFHHNKTKLPEIICIMIFIESPQKTILNDEAGTFILGKSILDSKKIPPWFKEIFYEALLWREGGKWSLRRVFTKENA